VDRFHLAREAADVVHPLRTAVVAVVARYSRTRMLKS
jgi:hypothetical protein